MSIFKKLSIALYSVHWHTYKNVHIKKLSTRAEAVAFYVADHLSYVKRPRRR